MSLGIELMGDRICRRRLRVDEEGLSISHATKESWPADLGLLFLVLWFSPIGTMNIYLKCSRLIQDIAPSDIRKEGNIHLADCTWFRKRPIDEIILYYTCSAA